MNILIDTNIFIPLEIVKSSDIEEQTHFANEFYRKAKELNYHINVLDTQKKDIISDKNEERKKTRLISFEKYELIKNIKTTETVKKYFSHIKENTHDFVDVSLLNALCANAVDLLVTEDEGIHKKAKKIGIEDKVYSLSDANAFIEAKLPKSLKIDNLSPIIEPEWCYNININDSFFDSLRNDYIGFNNWFKNKCQSEHRQCFVVKEQDKLEGICIYKTEDSEESVKYGMKGFVVKLCTFKLTIKGRKLGELLLKNIFSTCYNANVDWIYVTAFENNYICQFFESFGFEKYKLTKKDTGELIFRKRLNPNQSDLINTPLDYHIKFGPRYFETSQNSFLVPIKTSYHEMLFPELERQPLLFANFYPYSNAIKKAYISNSNTTLVNVGDILFFYRTHKDQSIQACGIVEELRRSSNPEEVLALAGKRTLYELKDISEMCKNRECLVILFRQAENLVKPIYLSDLTKIQLIKGVPQSISKLTDEAKKYILSEGTKLKLIV